MRNRHSQNREQLIMCASASVKGYLDGDAVRMYLFRNTTDALRQIHTTAVTSARACVPCMTAVTGSLRPLRVRAAIYDSVIFGNHFRCDVRAFVSEEKSRNGSLPSCIVIN